MRAAALVGLLLPGITVPSLNFAAPDDPEVELASFRVADGFSVNLYASEKDGVIKPIQNRFDAAGRLWVVGSTVYPQLEPGQIPNDKLIVIEDTNADGVADRSRVFADGLFIPTGIELGDGGAYVGNSTELLHLKDTDGDGIADERKVLLRGFGTGDNHQNLNSFQWGPGGELMFSQGLHANSRVETPWGVERLDHAGIWRLYPRRLSLAGFFGHEMAPHNPWGFVFDFWGQPLLFGGNGHGIFYPVPVMIRGHRIENIEQIWQNYRGRKICGADIVENSHFPEDWQGLVMAGGFMNNAVFALKVTENGSGYTVTDRPPLITSSSSSFRPVDVKFGADGALYVTDWYNPIIGHYQTSFRHPDRDKTHGRIWRVTAKGRPLVRQPPLVTASEQTLAGHLGSKDRFTRHFAKRILADRDFLSVSNAVVQWTTGIPQSSTNYDHALFEAIGVFEAHEVVQLDLLKKLLGAKEPGARAYAARVIGRWQDRLENPLGMLDPLFEDSHPRVRLEAVVAGTYIRTPQSIESILRAADLPVDMSIDYALRQAVYVLKPQWLERFENGKLDLSASPRRLEFLVKGDASPDTVRVLRHQLESAGLASTNRLALLVLLADTGSPEDLTLLINPSPSRQTGSRLDPTLHASALTALERASRVRGVRPPGDLSVPLSSLVETGNSREVQLAALRLATLWKPAAFAPTAERVATDSALDPEIRSVAASAWASISPSNAAPILSQLSSTGVSVSDHLVGKLGLIGIDPNAAARAASALLKESVSDPIVAAVMGGFTARLDGSSRLVTALEGTPPNRDSARLALRWLQANGSKESELMQAFSTAAQLGGQPLRATPDFIRQLSAEIQESGDAQRGMAIFRRPDLNCIACHRIGDEGGAMGPDLNAIGAGQPLDFIIGAVIDPNKEVKENYEAIDVTTRDGEVYSGYRVKMDDRELALRDVIRQEVVRLRRDRIKEMQQRGSVMPTGLVDHLTELNCEICSDIWQDSAARLREGRLSLCVMECPDIESADWTIDLLERPLENIFSAMRTILILTGLAILLTRGVAADPQAPKPPSSDKKPADSSKAFQNVDVAQFEKLRAQKDTVVLDVRSKAEFDAGHIPGAINLNVNSADFKEKAETLDKSKTYLVHCAAGVRSVKACNALAR